MKNIRVMLIDDEPHVLSALQRMLRYHRSSFGKRPSTRRYR